jgi:uncharacterized coiled-coil protein SlyX
MNSNDEVSELKQKIEKMEKYVKELEEHLKKYTNSNRHLKNIFPFEFTTIIIHYNPT